MNFEFKSSKLKYHSTVTGRIGYRGYTIEDIVNKDEGALSLSPSNIFEGKLVLDKRTYISWEKYEESPEIKISKGDLIFCKTGSSYGKATIIQHLPEPMTINPQLVVIKPYNCLPKFLYYALENKHTKNKIELIVGGGTMPTINQSDILNLKILVPMLKVQNFIVSFLDKKTSEIDALIADKEKLITLLEEKRQATITEAVTKRLDPNVKMKDSGVEWIGEIPEHWDMSKIKHISDINKNVLAENTSPEFKFNYMDISSVNSSGEIINIEKLTFKNAPSRARRVIREGDTLISTVRTYLQAITWIENIEGCLIGSTGYAVLTPKKDMEAQYLSYLMRSRIYIDKIVSMSNGVSYPATTSKDIGNLQVILPSIKEQKGIVRHLNKEIKNINSINEKLKFQISKFKEYRQSLIYEAVTGKIDIQEMKKEITQEEVSSS